MARSSGNTVARIPGPPVAVSGPSAASSHRNDLAVPPRDCGREHGKADARRLGCYDPAARMSGTVQTPDRFRAAVGLSFYRCTLGGDLAEKIGGDTGALSPLSWRSRRRGGACSALWTMHTWVTDTRHASRRIWLCWRRAGGSSRRD